MKKYDSKMSFFSPASNEDILNFSNQHNFQLPKSYVELISCFDGGELFIPGTVIYGILEHEHNKTVVDMNGKKYRSNSSMPRTLLIFGRLNFGDWICIDLNTSEIIEWDHELDEEYCKWNSMEEWLQETIENYDEYCGGND